MDPLNVLVFLIPLFLESVVISMLQTIEHNPGLLSTVTSFFGSILFIIRESMTSQ